MYRSNRFEEAEKILNFVIYDGHFDRAFRGNAVCVLAMMLEDSDNSEKLESLLNNLDGLDLTPRAKDAIAEIVTKK
jgi:hypothetical protein